MKAGEGRIIGLEIMQQTNEKIKVIREQIKMAQSKKKSYADN